MFTRLSRLRKDALRGESGMTLIEILVAVFILAVAVVALAATAASSLKSVRISRDRQDATQLASTILESARGVPYEDVILDTADNPPNGFDPTTGNGGCDPADVGCEAVVKLAGGAIDHVQSTGNHTATTYVSEVEGTSGKQVRVTTFVRWTDGGKERTVREETLVAQAMRGLPAPNFTVTPTSPSATGTPGETICINHTVLNTGEEDAYSWQLFALNLDSGVLEPGTLNTRTVNEPDGAGGINQVTRQGFKIQFNSSAKHWFGWARIAYPTTGSLQPMTDTTADGRPDSPIRVPALSEARINFCYTPLNASGVREATSTDPEFTPRIHSAFDETVTTASQNNELTNTLEVVSPNTTLYLHEDGRTLNTSPAPDDTQTDYDSDGIPGIALTSAPTSWSHSDFGNLFSSQKVLANPSLTFFARATDTDDPADTVADDETLTYEIQIQRGRAETTTVVAEASVEMTGVGTSWQQVTVALSFVSSDAADRTFQDDDVIFVSLACASSSTDTCHVHYDVTDLMSAFSGDFQ